MHITTLFLHHFAGQQFPMQVLSFEPSGMAYYGVQTDINQELNAQANAGPVVVDAVDRRAYWYERSSNLIASQVLGIGGNYQVRAYYYCCCWLLLLLLIHIFPFSFSGFPTKNYRCSHS